MPQIEKYYQWLTQGPTPDCDRILSAGLDHAEPAFAERISRTLLTRRQEQSWGVLIGRYDRLDETTRATLRAEPDLFRAGLTRAFQSGPECRVNALTAFEAAPSAGLAYLLIMGLSDPDTAIRDRCAALLKSIAEDYLRKQRADDATARDAQNDHRQLVDAAFEGGRTFHAHHCLDAVRVMLWFARDIGERFWDMVEGRRGRLQHVILEHVASWNSPFLAGFLLECLGRQTWRQTAGRILAKWSSPEEVIAILRHDDLLKRPDIQRGLASVRSPAWFQQWEKTSQAATPARRAAAPLWARYLGIPDAQKVALLVRWIDSREGDLRRAALYALASLDRDETLEVFERVARTSNPLSSFARWYVRSHQAELIKRPRRTETLLPDATTEAGDFVMLWQICRRSSPTMRMEVIAVLREHLDLWRPRLRPYFRSPDPRDRVLALQVISASEAAWKFRPELQALQGDTVEGIRALATRLMQMVDRRARGEEAAQIEPQREPDRPPAADNSPARQELSTLLGQLSGAPQRINPDAIRKVRELLGKMRDETEARK